MLEEYLTYFTDDANPDVIFIPGETGVMLHDGKKGFKEAIKFLKKQKSLPAAMVDTKALENASLDHANDLADKKIRGHQGSDGSTFQTRIEKYAKWGGAIFEAISYGPKTAEKVLVDFIVDVGLPKRSHRAAIF